MGPKAERHFTPIDGRMRFYANGHGYFVVGEKIRYWRVRRRRDRRGGGRTLCFQAR
jgi:hypothetical protein